MILLIDNYDSFVHNLARYFRLLGCETLVVRNDAIDARQVRDLAPSAVVLSPGPCSPAEAGASLEIVRTLHTEIPMIGICLGHQTIAAALGGRVERAPRPVHGRETLIRHDGRGVFLGVENPLRVGRYHSLTVVGESLPESLVPTAWTDDGVLMAIQHGTLPLVGLQFHPESVLTNSGLVMLSNFLKLAGLSSQPVTATGGA
jgi:anthranilate synthase/aminodeoxychorismate synthase-like glutamine amidotransferase